MKSLESIIKLALSILLFAVSTLAVNAQNPSYICELRNDAQSTDRIYEFDVMIQRTGAIPLELNSFQFGINVNSLMLNGGTMSVSLVPGTSELTNIAQIPTPIKFSFNGTKSCIIMTATSGPGPGNGSIISNISPGTRFCRLRLTNTVPFGVCQPNLTWSFSLLNGYQTKMFAYVNSLATDITVPASHTTNLNNLTLNSLPITYNVTGTGSYCQGTTGLPVGLDGSEIGVTYTLYKGGVAQLPTVTGTGAVLSFGDQLAGTYTVSGTNTGGTTAMTGSAVITENALPSVGISNDNGLALSCSVPSTTLTATGGIAYSWSDGSTVVGTSQTLLVSSAGTFTVTVTDANGCSATAQAITTLDNATPVAGITSDNGLALSCSVPSTTLTATGGIAYSWSDGSTVVGTSQTLLVSSAGTFTVTVTDANGCSATAQAITTLDNATPVAGITSDNGLALSCSVPSTTLTATGGIAYSWSDGSTVVGTSQTLLVSSAGTFTVTVTDANGCSATAQAITTLDNATPVAVITNNTGTTVINCTTSTISLTASGGTSYFWNNGLGTNATVQITSAGNYQVTVTNANGCSSVSSINITQAQGISTVTATAGTITTVGGTTTLTVTQTGGQTPYTYSLNGGTYQIANTFTVGAGSYTVTVKDANGCTMNSNVVTITEPVMISTSLVYNGTTSVQYYSTAILSATLKDSKNKVLSGMTITFTVGSQSITAVTNNKGLASTSLQISQAVGTYSINTSFAGDVTYMNSVDNIHTLTVTRKPVTASLTGTVTKVYDGNAIAYMLPANYILSGAITGDVVSLNNPLYGTYNNNKVGSGKKVTVTGLALMGTNSGNYLLSSTTASANIGIITAVKSATILPDVTANVQSVEFPTLKVYPNPFTEKLNIEFSSPIDTHAKIEIFNIAGARLEMLFDGNIKAGASHNVEYIPRLVSSQIVIYRITINGEVQQGKIIYKERK